MSSLLSRYCPPSIWTVHVLLPYLCLIESYKLNNTQMKKQRFLLVAAVLIITSALSSYAQNIHISGEVKDAHTNEPTEFAHVVLQTGDSTFVAGVSTNAKGRFQLDKVVEGNYRLIVSAIGYVNNVTELEGLTRSINLGELILSPKAVVLDEVMVTGSNVQNQSDRKVIFPSEKQLKSATNGINLLSSMMLPRLLVNPVINSLSLSTQEELQLRINGVQVGTQEIMALQPADVIRIEYIETPGLRYGNAGAVLNYITRRYESGGALSLNLLQSPHLPFGNYNLSSRFNHKKSEFGVNYSSTVRDFKSLWRENEEVFHLEDGSELIRKEIGEPGRLAKHNHNLNLNYNIQSSEKSYFNATLRYSGDLTPHLDYYSALFDNQQPDANIQMADLSDSKSHSPSLDLYLMQTLKNKQTLILNAVGTYINQSNKHTYRERLADANLTDVYSRVDGDKYSFIGEAIYEKEWKVGRLSAGMKHTQAFSDNDYTGTVNYQTKMQQSTTYAYTQFSGKVNQLSYLLGLGVNRNWLKQEGEEGYQTYAFRPRFTLNYAPVNHFYLRLGGQVENIAPSLSELSAVEQYIDSRQMQRGNPALNPYQLYKLDFSSEYRIGKFSVSAWAAYMNMPKAIMPSITREEGLFVHSFENQKRMQKLWSSLTLKANLFRDIVSLSVTGGANHYQSDGNSYKHKYTNLYYRVSLFANYKQWTLMANQYSAFNNFWGEQMKGGENGQELMVVYRHKGWNFGAGMANPLLNQFKVESEDRNQYASNNRTEFINDSAQMFVLQVSWNFSFGRKHQSAEKRLNNSDNDSGVMKAGK